MISKTKISKRIKKKKNPSLVETLSACKKNDAWLKVGQLLSISRRKRVSMNLSEISEKGEKGEKVLLPGKVLSQGEIDKKIQIIALDFSENAKEKLDKSKIEFNTIIEEIKKNPDAKGIKILK
jgi:large subunit ribosomal protein L18e